ncbi:hypothetical protein P9239_23210 [Caballeronia sp. LZ062]|uniref:hypothetical protein n=1 Tax=unclassified Caballeronia TaxID=2646786 RepID=UPI0028646EBB|nr:MULTISPECIES: hypothetical protein [unclassified Caballeronia]MDR5856596.1 hypothetical protein [Caballeronia sp. LZ050]MDR5873266.1 hypothetical protein [Caballeronia sp. LZ062]
MKIVCVAWGSLLWNLKGFPIDGEWREGGPLIPLEFARHSDGEIVSLVVLERGPLQPTFWAPVALDSLDAAREALRAREDVRVNVAEWIGSIPAPAGITYAQSHALATWLERNGADAVIWTALPPKSRETNGRMPSVDEAVTYLQSLGEDECRRAEAYVRQSPAGIRTPFRERFEAVFGWTPTPADG